MIKEINLDNYSLIDTKSASSKGNQQKWLVNDLWYKADHMGYEGLCEVIVSELLSLLVCSLGLALLWKSFLIVRLLQRS